MSGSIEEKMKSMLTEKDVKQIESSGRDVAAIVRDMATIARGKQFVELLEPATKKNGRIKIIDPEEMSDLAELASDKVEKSCLKFVPASGAASRMFKTLNAVLQKYKKADEVEDKDFNLFWKNLKSFPFFEELKNAMSKDKIDIEVEIAEGKIDQILKYLLTNVGLDYASQPKLFLKFHLDDEHPRTAIEEHVKESIWLSGGKVHFTISPKFREEAEKMAAELKKAYAKDKFKIEITFSEQQEVTDTIAMLPDGSAPFRAPEGGLYFRQSGHGALAMNMNEQAANARFLMIQNVDNLPGGSQEILLWKRALLGYAYKLQDKIRSIVRTVSASSLDEGALELAAEFAVNELFQPIDLHEFKNLQVEQKEEMLLKVLHRPLVVSSMVPNSGEPGGGPFNVGDPVTGMTRNEIIEGSQINEDDSDQKKILEKSTHFNPVFLIVATKDAFGEKFDFAKFAYREGPSVFVVEKSYPGTGDSFKSLDTGLWNGEIWNTIQIFVEVPAKTFGPAKTVLDLNPEIRPFRKDTPYREILPEFSFS